VIIFARISGVELEYFSDEMFSFDKLQRPLPVASIFLPILSMRSNMIILFRLEGVDSLKKVIAADKPAAPPPTITKSKIMDAHLSTNPISIL